MKCRHLNWLISIILFIFFISINNVSAQRIYAANSVLANGNWYKIGVRQDGIYRIDVNFLNSLGVNTTNLSSSSIKLFGNGGGMFDEKNSIPRPDDLIENAIEVVDGGDGIFNNNDYFLFYGASPNKWLKDSINQRFNHQKNLFSDTSFYFLTIGTNGKRIATKTITATPNKLVTSYNERYFYENDAVNFLNSGKEWYGEEFSNLPGGSLTKQFNVDFTGLNVTQPLHIATSFASRSVGAASSFTTNVNNQTLQSINMGSVSGNYLDAFATTNTQRNNFFATSANLNVNFSFVPASIGAQGWLNWFELHGRRNLAMNNQNQFTYRDWQSVGVGNIASYTINNATNTTVVWDVTNPLIPEKMSSAFSGNQLSYLNDASTLKEYIVFNNTNFLTPTSLGKVDNQNLHNSQVVDYIIIAPAIFLQEAKRLALFHTQQYNYKVVVASTQQIFNEFGGGAPDATAIRDFVKMYYDKAGTDTTKRPKYLMLFGSASFDFKNRIANNTNYVPCYESVNSVDPLSTYTSDDFFGLLNDGDDVNLVAPPNELDIAIGRLPINSLTQAKNIVDKIINYHSKESLGAWRNNTVFVADDKDGNTHLQDAEFINNNAKATNNLFNQSKIYLDAYPLVSGAGGGRYPQVNNAIVNEVSSGTLIFNYSGHGGYERLADEAIFGQEEANQFNNINKLPLFITATCDFAPYDDPTKNSLGSSLLVKNSTGAIGLITTTRVVFAFSNRILNNNFLKTILQKDNASNYLTLGEAIKRAKNFTYQTFADVINNRKFTLIGDPGITLAFPQFNVELTAINNQTISGNDTLKALNKYTFSGKVTDASGLLQNSFNGTLYPSVFDKPQVLQTLGNDPASPITNYSQQKNILYKGKATVSNGLFNFTFIVPKDINYQIDKGRLSLYADNGSKDANGVSNSFFVGGISTQINADTKGPDIKCFLNDEKFVNGGLVNEKPILLVKLFDSSGINTVGTGIGHDITATIDGNDKKIIVLNNFYESALDTYQKGTIKFQLPELEEGNHFIKLKAWDVANNSNEVIIEFTVAKMQQLQIKHVYNYPNPFTTKTNFWFEHNQPNTQLQVLINIFSITGKLVHQIQKNVSSMGNRISEIEWGGKDIYNQKLGKGVYIYRIIVTNYAGQRAEATQKLYML